MSKRSIAHISDLHIGCSPQHSLAAVHLCAAINASDIDQVIVTGDVTEHGKFSEFAEFKKIFQSLKSQIKLTIVPGNHDYLNDCVASEMMSGPRADLTSQDGVSIIRINTTHGLNRFLIAGHGKIDQWIFNEVDQLLKRIPHSDFVIVALHHHLLRLPEEIFIERLSSWLHLPFASELARGSQLLERLKEHCDIVLHGHRHFESEKIFSDLSRTLRVYNAGSSTVLGKFRRFIYQDGKLIAPPVWIQVS